MGIYGAIAIRAFLIFLLRYGMNALPRLMIRHVRRKRMAAPSQIWQQARQDQALTHRAFRQSDKIAWQ
ncbi:hypothetical protein VHN57_05460 [Sphingobium sp. WW5]|uniref:hypothetical protein n=1 Tax=unclassified Sphingobium TaxID=2611147 RepID=UPI003C15D5F3